MKAFKFIIPPRDPRVFATLPGGELTAEGCIAIALAESAQAARELLERIAAEQGDDSRWLKVATVTELDLDTPKRLCWVLL